MPATFNPQEFFDQTANYASAARGAFTIPAMAKPGTDASLKCFAPVLADPRIAAGTLMLAKGLVAKGFSIPSVSLGTYQPTSHMGPTTKKPYGMFFSDITVDFHLMGQTLVEAKSLYFTFNTWLELIAGPRHFPTDHDHSVRSDSTYFSVAYYDDYNTQGIAEIYSPTSDPNEPLIKISYSEMYPIAIGALQTSWDSKDTPLSLSVTFAYHYAQQL